MRIAAERDRAAEQRAVADRERARAEEVSSFLVNSLLELGRAHMGAGDLGGAEAPLQEARRLSQDGFGAASQESGRALWVLGVLRYRQGQFAAAKELFNRSLNILETTAAPATDVSALLDDLAQVYGSEQQWTLAKHTYERALGSRQLRPAAAA